MLFEDSETVHQPSPHVEFIENAAREVRFRYECEGEPAPIQGANSTTDKKTYTTIKVCDFVGPAHVVVSCVTESLPYRPHPHNLVGQKECKNGICILNIPQNTMKVQFKHVGIQCVKKKDMQSSLKVRERFSVDPFGTGFEHVHNLQSIRKHVVRLCFQVYINGEFALQPIVSEPIFDSKCSARLRIIRLSDCVCHVDGNKHIILLCEKIDKEDIQIRFFEENNGRIIWEDIGRFHPSDIHKQLAIPFRTPPYHNREITEPVHVLVQLRRPSDNTTSIAVPFEYYPRRERKKKRKLLPFISAKVVSADEVLKSDFKTQDQTNDLSLGTSAGPSISSDINHQSHLWNIPRSENFASQKSTELKRISLNSGDLETYSSSDIDNLLEALDTTSPLPDMDIFNL